jgi:antitoxin component of MazEF toxin-antitoxin module
LVEVVTVARKWGNSVGITLPKEVVESEKIHFNDRLIVKVEKVTPIENLFGTLKSKRSTQSIMDEVRKGWD